MASDKLPAPSRRTGGRTAPKGGPTRRNADHVDHAGPGASTRYTPPDPTRHMPSPRWIPAVMIMLLVLGLLVIFLHYVGLFLPGATSNWWLLGGLGLILGGIITATQYR
jgi:hypothetical protein